MNLLLAEDHVEVWHGDGQAFARGLDLSGAVVIADLPYGSGAYKTDVAFAPETIAHLLTAWTCALFGWPEDLVALCVEHRVVPEEWVTWWPRNKCHPRAKNLTEAECIAVFGRVPGRDRIRRPRSEAGVRMLREMGAGKVVAADTGGRRLDRARRDRVSKGPVDTARDGDVWPINAPGCGFNAANRRHPNEKPLELMERLVLLCSDPGDLIIDPCCGSGTTIEAARKLGRRAIGIDVVEAHCLTAVERLGQQVLPGVAG